MKVKIFDKIYEVEKTVYCEEEKGTYYYLKGKKIPYCDLDYDIEIINESKGLKALENIKREAGTPYFSTLYDIDMWREDFATVEKELKEYESRKTLLENIDKDIVVFEPKEVWEEKLKKLKRLEELEKEWEMEHTLRIRLENINYELVREKQENTKLKALEIIKEYQVDVALLIDCQCEEEYLNRLCNRYLAIREKLGYKRLGKEKFDLLKEVFENEH